MMSCLSNDLPSVCIIILNWNGWKDTIECLDSVLKMEYREKNIILIDNASKDTSVEEICTWFKKNGLLFTLSTTDEIRSNTLKTMKNCGLRKIEKSKDRQTNNYIYHDILFLQSAENLGFARGNNLAIKYAINHNYQYVMLLNNDTTIEKDALIHLVNHMENNPQTGACTPVILYYSDPTIISNAGGYLTFTGHRKYYRHNKKYTLHDNNTKPISFITGCALMVRTVVFKRYGLLSEDYFFGEEDYEFSIRMKKNHVRMMCVSTAKIYHKIAQSSCRLFTKIDTFLIYYLNRFVNLKQIYPHGYWEIWRYGVLLYIVPLLLIKYRFRLHILFRFAQDLLKYSKLYSRVTRDIIEKIKAWEKA